MLDSTISSIGYFAVSISPIDNGIITIPSGMWFGFPLDMISRPMLQIRLVQASYTQDFSLRAWVSINPKGERLSPILPVLRTAVLPLVLYIDGQVPPEQSIPVLVSPGQYILNVLNLTNQQNLVELSFSG